MRAATAISWLRMVAPRALAPEAPATAAARVRLWQMAARASQQHWPGNALMAGREGAADQSANTCSTMAWSRCCASAWIVSNGESVNRAW